MDAAELRFRILCEARKIAGRVRTTLAPPAWKRSALVSILADGLPGPTWQSVVAALKREDYLAAHGSLADHFASRSSAFAINAREVPAIAAAIDSAFPAARDAAVSRARTLIGGRYDLLGYHGLEIGISPDWHADAVHDRASPRRYWAAVPYLDPAAGDHKVIWELNRHQHWLAFARAGALSGDPQFRDAFIAQLTGWMAANPPLMGTNWASMLELAFRCLSWLWALEVFAPASSAGDPQPWLVDLLIGLDRQLTHVEHNVSRYFSPNTHLSGEALALYAAGCALPELAASARRVAIGREILLAEAARQIRADGGHAELSAHYHRYSTDFYLLALRVARRAGDPAASAFEEAVVKQARYLRAICDDRGERPAIGDDDGGQLFPICGRSPEDCRDTLASAAILVNEPALAIGEIPEESYWLCGTGAAGRRATAASWPSSALTASGYFVSRTGRGDHLVFDAGPHGFLNGGHAHADALSCTLSVRGRPLLIDPGTGTYTMDGELRDRFRSTAMHNTIVLNGSDQSRPAGPFHWRSATGAEARLWRSSADCDYVEGTHSAYAPVRHTRSIIAIEGVGWWILDHLLGVAGVVRAEHYWHLHPQWRPSLDTPHVCRLTSGNEVLAIASTSSIVLLEAGAHPLAIRSPAYGRIEPSPVLRAETTASAATTVATFVAATAGLTAGLALERASLAVAPGPGWHGGAFRLRWAAGTMTVLAAVETHPSTPGDDAAPSVRWGTAELQTDGRAAVVIERLDGSAEVLVVNGTVIESPARRLLSLQHSAPLLRRTSNPVAPSVHEVVFADKGFRRDSRLGIRD